jgi:DNA-binding transcriptional ArsR family regulator
MKYTSYITVDDGPEANAMNGHSRGCGPVGGALPAVEEVRGAVALLSVMSHEIRLRVLVALSRCGPMAVGRLQELLGVEQSALSHQLRTLRDAGLVVGERDGKQVIYRLDDDHVAHVVEDTLAHAAEGER